MGRPYCISSVYYYYYYYYYSFSSASHCRAVPTPILMKLYTMTWPYYGSTLVTLYQWNSHIDRVMGLESYHWTLWGKFSNFYNLKTKSARHLKLSLNILESCLLSICHICIILLHELPPLENFQIAITREPLVVEVWNFHQTFRHVILHKIEPSFHSL